MIAEIVRIIAVIALLIAASLLTTRKGALPLALRGVYKILGRNPDSGKGAIPPLWKRLLAFALVIIAILIAIT